MKLLRHAILVLGERCNTLLISANSSKACFDTLRSCLDMPQNLASSIIDHTYILHLACARLTLRMRTPSGVAKWAGPGIFPHTSNISSRKTSSEDVWSVYHTHALGFVSHIVTVVKHFSTFYNKNSSVSAINSYSRTCICIHSVPHINSTCKAFQYILHTSVSGTIAINSETLSASLC